MFSLVRQLTCLLFLTSSTNRSRKRGSKNMGNDRELIEWIIRDKSKIRKDLNHNQKKVYLNKLHAKIDQSRLRKKNKSSRFFIDNEYVQGGYLATLSKLCTSVYMALLVHCNTESQAAFPSITTIQELVGSKNRSSIIKAIRILEGYGIIGVTRADGAFNMVNLYTFQSSELWLSVVMKNKTHSAEALWGLYPMIPNE